MHNHRRPSALKATTASWSVIAAAIVAIACVRIGLAEDDSPSRSAARWLDDAEAAIATVDNKNAAELLWSNVVVARAWIGDVEGVQRAAGHLPQETTRRWTTAVLVTALAEAGDFPTARTLVEQIADDKQVIDWTRWRAALMLPTQTSHPDMAQLLELHANAALKVGLQQMIALKQAERRDFDAAHATAAAIAEESARQSTQVIIVGMQAADGSFSDAQILTARIPDRLTQTQAYALIALHQADKQDVQGARLSIASAVAASRPLNRFVASSMSRLLIAIAMARAGDVAAAEEKLKQIASGAPRDAAAGWVAAVYARAANAAAAGKTIAAIRNNTAKDQARAGVAIAIADIDRLQEAITFAGDISDPATRAVALIHIADRQVNGPDVTSVSKTVALARQAIEKIVDPEHRAASFGMIAEIRGRAGDLEGGRKAIQLAREAAAEIRQSYVRQRLIGMIAAYQAKAGDSAGALATADELTDRTLICLTHFSIAIAQARAGDLESARATFARVADRCNDLQLITGLGLAQVTATDLAGAMQTVNRNRNSLARANICAAIAHAMSRAGDDAAMAEWMQSLTDSLELASARIGAAAGLVARARFGKPIHGADEPWTLGALEPIIR